MNIKYSYLLDAISEIDLHEVSSKIKLGFEKESLRVASSKISAEKHPYSLGSSGYNRFITTDFSEAQLELITPPMDGSFESINFLDDLQHFVQENIKDEILWPLSIPPTISSEDEVPVAEYGPSHEGRFKHIYRIGLENRYGKIMQAISGFHFNYSLPKSMWDSISNETSLDAAEIRSEVYFNILRNIFQFNWLLIYLFGSSPVIGKHLLKDTKDSFIQLDEHSIHLPYATSLRMSEHGYSNSERKRINISINSLDEYSSDLYQATITENPTYIVYEENKDSQLNANILQIEAEYYAVARAKSQAEYSRRPSVNLKHGGVDFIEIRSLDLNPFSRIGISQETIDFLEVFILFCMLNVCRKFDKETMKIIHSNDIMVAKYGRMPDLKINNNNKNILIKTWAFEIIEGMRLIAEKLDNSDKSYSEMINKFRSQIENPDETLSAKIMSELKDKKMSHDEFGDYYGSTYKSQYKKRRKFENKLWEKFEKEQALSIAKQREHEESTRSSEKTFKDFKQEYFDIKFK